MITLGTSYNDHNLALVKGMKHNIQLDWGDYPVKVEKDLFDIIPIGFALPILTDVSRTSSEIAGIEEVCDPMIVSIDKEFTKAILYYQNDLIRAEGNDLNKIYNLERTYTIKSYGGCFGWFWSMLEKCGCNYRSDEHVKEKGSTHRIRWLMATATREEERIKGVEARLSYKIKILEADLRGLEKEGGQIDINKQKQLKQLKAIFSALFPMKASTIQNDESGYELLL